MNEKHLNIELINRLRQGKEKAFRSVFNTYFESLEVFAKAYVGDDEIAKDMVQDVFTNLWGKRTTLPDKIYLKAYLYQATRNTCLNYLKRLKVQAKFEKRTVDNYNDLLLNYEALSQLNLDTLSYDELLETLNKAINQLPEKCREVFELSRYEGMKNREIAEMLNISVKAVEGHISKALRQLKDQLKTHYSSGIILFLLARERYL
ncbi:RNA polymerase sigma-70 factor [Gaoshiqia sediminis]|uniref:RNA polymerase sigma-70 factor n=1 Tax=Gaoshiqia sediminis TaxID=2986998 RepID=A0AA41YCN1_9BACT|nr:RNA polymerase sigma-70 factor [Gaoshiqia sediminis]MCW0483940.1 RNA polymerase sigma-70 factor [Gaoshiqia sediminis]